MLRLPSLLLYRSGYMVGKYISLASKIAREKNPYYDALEQSQSGWHEWHGVKFCVSEIRQRQGWRRGTEQSGG